jgi:hypothetical protein
MKNKKYHIVTKANINFGTPVMKIHASCVIGGVAGFIAGAVLAVDKYKSVLD